MATIGSISGNRHRACAGAGNCGGPRGVLAVVGERGGGDGGIGGGVDVRAAVAVLPVLCRFLPSLLLAGEGPRRVRTAPKDKHHQRHFHRVHDHTAALSNQQHFDRVATVRTQKQHLHRVYTESPA